MASSIFFNGRVTQIPGSYSEVDASGLSVVGLGASGIVAVIGEAEGGSPYNGETPVHRISNPGKIAKTFRRGDLREAGNMAFDPSKDPDIPAGAQQVKFVKVNPATRSQRTFQRSGVDVLKLTSKDYGVFTTQINVEIADGTNQGKAVTIRFEDATEVFDDIGGDAAFSALYTPGANGATTMSMELENGTGVEALFTKAAAGADSAYLGELNELAGLNTDKDNNVGAGNVVNVVSSSSADTTQSVTVYGLNTLNAPASETLLLNGTTPVVGVQTWNAVHGIVKSAATAGNITLRDNTTTSILYVLDTPASLTAGGGVNDFAGTMVESVASTVTVVSNGASTQVVLLIGRNAVDVATIEKITLTGTTPVTSTTSWTRLDAVALGYFEAAQELTIAGQLFNYGDTVSIKSSSAGDTSSKKLTVFGLDSNGDPQSEQLSFNGTTLVTGTATWRRVFGVLLNTNTVGTVTVSAMESVAGVGNLRIFSFDGATALSAGLRIVDNVVVSNSVLTAVANAATTRPIILIGLDENGVAQIEEITLNGTTPVAGTALWSELTAVGVGHLQDARTATISGSAFDLPTSSYETVQEVADKINAASGWAITIGANAGPILISDMDDSGVLSVLVSQDFFADLAFIVAKINDESQLITAEVVTGATGSPDNTASPVFLTGGVEGTTSFADWQAALDLLRTEFVNTIVVLTDDAAVHAAVVSHCTYMSGPGRKERDCVLGEESGISFTAAKAAAVALNTRHARLCIQDITRFNVDGVEEQFPPYFAAAVIAGMQGGADVGLPLTFKYANVLDVVGDDSTYTLQDDANELIASGLLVLEEVQGIGFRVLRNITTHLIDNNIAYVEASVNQAVNFATYNLRANMEAAVGKKGFAGTVNAALGIAVATLGQLIDSGAIVDWRNLTIELELDVMTLDVEIAPVLPVNFVKSTIHLISASFSAAA